MLAGATKQLFQTDANGNITGVNPYVPYSTNAADYVAGFSPMQQQSFAQAANLQVPGQYQGASDFANAAGMGGLQSAQQAYGYGNAGFQSGQLGQQLGIQGGQYYGNMGAQSGLLGQQLGIQGGQYYGGMGAGYGQQAANLAGNALGYGQAGAGYGDLASQLGLQGLQAQQYGMGIGNQAQNRSEEHTSELQSH